MRAVLVVALLIATLVAGCSGNGTTPPATDVVPEAFQQIQVTATTGAIRGIVVSEAVVPIANVTVKLLSVNKTKTTDAQGAFVFTDLEGGDYFLSVSKTGYFSVQASATVTPGLAEPPIVKVQLKVDISTQPYTELLKWTGFFACGVGTDGGGAVHAGVNPCAVDAITCDLSGVCLLGSSNVHEFVFGTPRVPEWAQAEAVWEGTQPLGNYLNMGWYDSGTADFKSATGTSPLTVPTDHAEIVKVHTENATSLTVRIFPGGSQSLTVTLQQKFDVYVTYFYGFVPREGWTFVADGECTTPEQCGA
jgi:hypothetical protein